MRGARKSSKIFVAKECELRRPAPPLCILYWSISFHKAGSILSVSIMPPKDPYPFNHSCQSCHLVQSRAAWPRGGQGCCRSARTGSCHPPQPLKLFIEFCKFCGFNFEKKKKSSPTEETVETRLMSSLSSIPSLDGASSSANASLSSPAAIMLSPRWLVVWWLNCPTICVYKIRLFCRSPVLWDSFSESMKESLFSDRTLSPNLRRRIINCCFGENPEIPISRQFGLFEDVLLEGWYFVQGGTPVNRSHLWIRSLHTPCLRFWLLHLEIARMNFVTLLVRFWDALIPTLQRLMGYWRDWGWIKNKHRLLLIFNGLIATKRWMTASSLL